LGNPGFVHFLPFEKFSFCIFSPFSRNSRSGWFLFCQGTFWRDLWVILVLCIFSLLRHSRFAYFLHFREILVLVGFCSVKAPWEPRQGTSLHFTKLHFAHTQTSDLPPFTPRHYTPPSHPTTHYLLIPVPAPCTLHPPITPPTQSSRNFCSIVFPKYCSQRRLHNSLTVEWERRSVNPQLWRFTNNNLGLPHAPSLSVCLFQ